MADTAYGPWRSFSVSEVVQAMSAFDAPWWFTGGHALELHLGRSWREHDDIDVGICRSDAGRLRALSTIGELHIAAAGVLRPWRDEALIEDHHENNVWIRRADETWCLDIVIGEGDRSMWTYRRDQSLRLPWDRVVLSTSDGVPYLAPALQLLFKSATVRPKDQLDADIVIPTLDDWSLALLDIRLPWGHPWLSLVAQHRRGMRGADVHELVNLLLDAGVTVWVDGGWGIDALFGEQTRPHGDLDIALPTRYWAVARATLESASFVLVRNDGPHNIVLADPLGRLVDMHAYDDESTVLGADGIERHGPNGLAYESGGFCGVGTIAGRAVQCMSAEFQVRSHTGYEHDDDDAHDVLLLHERFGIALPEQYRRGSVGQSSPSIGSRRS